MLKCFKCNWFRRRGWYGSEFVFEALANAGVAIDMEEDQSQCAGCGLRACTRHGRQFIEDAEKSFF